MTNRIEDQDNFVKNVMGMMTNVLVACNKNKTDCICVTRVKYLQDRDDLPEHKRYFTEIFCDENGSKFHQNIANELDNKFGKYK